MGIGSSWGWGAPGIVCTGSEASGPIKRGGAGGRSVPFFFSFKTQSSYAHPQGIYDEPPGTSLDPRYVQVNLHDRQRGGTGPEVQ